MEISYAQTMNGRDSFFKWLRYSIQPPGSLLSLSDVVLRLTYRQPTSSYYVYYQFSHFACNCNVIKI